MCTSAEKGQMMQKSSGFELTGWFEESRSLPHYKRANGSGRTEGSAYILDTTSTARSERSCSGDFPQARRIARAKERAER